MTIRRAPIEDDPAYRGLLDAVEAVVNADLKAKGYDRQMGYCHFFWMEKERVLRHDHGIEWKSPAELNPGVLFD